MTEHGAEIRLRILCLLLAGPTSHCGQFSLYNKGCGVRVSFPPKNTADKYVFICGVACVAVASYIALKPLQNFNKDGFLARLQPCNMYI